ncbi:MAG: glutamate-5-semialdehyde dehydrogenase [Proteobacteria bacterium]|nr:glutamate-5-semialdehyde dehydrogenase [Pseudomonadota bacterium]MBU1232594.1 glutamate-5-semialdehyde dehydrogenase [Pseudomonadota bacterium]MBU1417047.1 glutamate-5-semialdehyde dehydrogenase [Pseudomonadota bacterium]MBU1453743.1 glutamate-5-semialdehyde dehydrogenase [Pseudomonadota bacterium]
MSHSEKLATDIKQMAKQAKIAARTLATLSTEAKNNVLLHMVDAIDAKRQYIQNENAKDLVAGKEKGLSPAMLDRLELSDKVITSMMDGLREVAALPDPVGEIEKMVKRPNGLMVGRMRVPLGVIGMIYESRPNVTVDAAALCLKAGNAILLRGGSEAIHSNRALASVLQEALLSQGVAAEAIQVIPVTDREAVNIMLSQEEYLDLIIPRGGEGLIRFVSETSRIPVLKHYKGVCHIYVDRDADLEKATPIILNSKAQRPGVCNALEGLLVHKDIAESYLPALADSLNRADVRLLGCKESVQIVPSITPAMDSDWGTEFLDLILCVRVVADIDEALDYIAQYGSQHTESILTENYSNAQRFLAEVDASAVMVNTSTRFNDGGQLGLGAEIGISTTKLHAYGPMGLEELTTRKFVVYGQGQVRS